MQVSAAGLSRFVYNHSIGSAEIQDYEISSKPICNGLILGVPSGDVTICWHKHSVRLNGDYAFEMKLSRDEIARLFVESFGDIPLDQVLKALSDRHRTGDADPSNVAPAT